MGYSLKNSYYRFLEDCHANWNRFVMLLAARVITYFSGLTRPDRVKMLVLDDSIIPRERSKKTELLSHVYDHVRGKTVKGFNLLALGWTDAFSFVPVAFRMLRYAAPLVFSAISWCVLHASDKLMIEWMMGAAALGLYTAATKIPSLIHVIIGFFNQAWGLSSIREAETGKARDYYAPVFDRFTFFLFGAGILFIAVTKPFMRVYVGQAFQPSWVYTPFLLFAAVFYSVYSFMGSLYAALERTANDMRLSLLGAVMNVIINYFCIRSFGIGGAVTGTAVSYFTISMISIFDMKRYIPFRINLRRYGCYSLLILIAAAAETFTDCHVVISLACFAAFLLINRNELQGFWANLKKQRHTQGE